MSSETPDRASETTSSSPPTTPQQEAHARQEEKAVDASLRESFPASDPPPWNPHMGTRSDTLDDSAEQQSTTLPSRDSARMPWLEWAERMCVALDEGELEHFSAFLADDVWFRFGDADPVIGRDHVVSWLREVFSVIGTVKHRVIDVRAKGDAVIVETDATYRTADGSKRVLPEALSFRLRGDRASRVQIYGPACLVLGLPKTE